MRTSLGTVLLALLVLPTSIAGASEPKDRPSRHTGDLSPSRHQVTRRADRVPAHAPPAESQSTAAPVPNRDMTAPAEPENPRTHLAPAIFRLSYQYPGYGYVYGSSPKAMDDSKAALIPGLKLTTPLP
jgi:hypothetical protein